MSIFETAEEVVPPIRLIESNLRCDGTLDDVSKVEDTSKSIIMGIDEVIPSNKPRNAPMSFDLKLVEKKEKEKTTISVTLRCGLKIFLINLSNPEFKSSCQYNIECINKRSPRELKCISSAQNRICSCITNNKIGNGIHLEIYILEKKTELNILVDDKTIYSGNMVMPDLVIRCPSL
jgi:hypothetical protein